MTAEGAPLRLLRLPEVLGRVGVRKSAWYALIATGKAPRPVKLGERCSAWIENEVDQWVRERIAESRSEVEVQP